MNALAKLRRSPAPDAEASPPPQPEQPAFSPGVQMLRDVSPKWAALHDRFTALIAREEEIMQQMAPLRRALKNAGAMSEARNLPEVYVPPPPLSPAQQAAAERRAGLLAAALQGIEIPPPPSPPPPPPFRRHRDPRMPALQALSEELAAVREAIRLLRPEMERAHSAASKILCERRRPEYAIIAARFCAALVELGNAIVAHQNFAAEMKHAQWGRIRPVQVDAFGDPRDPTSHIRRELSWAAENGWFDAANIPAEWSAKR